MIALAPRLVRRRAFVGGAVVAAAVAAAAIALVDPFGGTGASGSGELDNGSPISLATVTRQDLSSQTQVSATLGYADASTIALPAGTAPSALQQAEQTAASASASLEAAKATLAADARALQQARETLTADRRKRGIDCGGPGAAQAPAAGGGSGGSAGACATDAQAVATDEQAVTAAEVKADADRHAVASAQTALAGAEDALATAEASASAYGQSSVYTMLPKVGQMIRRGQALYAIDGRPTVLLYGSVTAWRAFAAGMSPDRDVAQLNANLRAFGYGRASGDAFTADTAAAIRALQAARGLAATGELPLGAVVFEPGPVRVTSVTPARGAPVQAGTVLGVTSTKRQVSISLDASQQTSVKVGDPVTITLPDNSTTPGHVTYVGTVATTPSGSNGESQTPTIEVHVTPDRPRDTGRLDQAPVDVSITTASVKNVLVVPVNALLALASGGYAVERVEADGTRRLVPVSLGLFDDAEGLVEVSGSGLAASQRVVVPGS